MGFFYPQWQKIIRIGVTTPPTTTGYQVKVEIPWQPGMRDDFADLRFSDYYRTLPYWIETSTTRVTATVWIKLTEINEASREFFCYYGNGGAVSESSGTNTFDFFDDFDTYNTGVWTTVSGSPSTSSGILTLQTSAGTPEQLIESKTKWSTNSTIVRSRVKTEHWNSAVGEETWGVRQDWVNYYCTMDPAHREVTYRTKYTNWQTPTPTHQSISGWSAGTFYVSEVKRPSGSSVWTVNDASQVTVSGAPNVDMYIVFHAGYLSAQTTFYVDWVLVRKYQATESTCTPAESRINTAFYQALLRAKHVFDAATYPYTLAVSFVTDHMHLTWTEP